VVKHTPSTICIQEVRSAAGLERHVMIVFNRDEFERSLEKAGLTLFDRDYTDEIHRVEGLDERVFHLNYLLRRANPGQPAISPSQACGTAL